MDVAGVRDAIKAEIEALSPDMTYLGGTSFAYVDGGLSEVLAKARDRTFAIVFDGGGQVLAADGGPLFTSDSWLSEHMIVLVYTSGPDVDQRMGLDSVQIVQRLWQLPQLLTGPVKTYQGLVLCEGVLASLQGERGRTVSLIRVSSRYKLS